MHTILGDYETNGTMKEMEEKLKGMNFCRGNKGYLINLQHVDGIQDGCAMVKGEQLVLSRARKKEFMEELTKYWGEVIKVMNDFMPDIPRFTPHLPNGLRA